MQHKWPLGKGNNTKNIAHFTVRSRRNSFQQTFATRTSQEEEGVKTSSPLPAQNVTCARAPLAGRTNNCRLRRHAVHEGRELGRVEYTLYRGTSLSSEEDHTVLRKTPSNSAYSRHLRPYGLAEPHISRFRRYTIGGDPRCLHRLCSMVDPVRGQATKYGCNNATDKVSVQHRKRDPSRGSVCGRVNHVLHRQRVARLVRQKTL